MKNRKSIQILFFCLPIFCGIANNTIAQTTSSKKDMFTGAWQVTQVVAQGEKSSVINGPAIKIFDGYGNFYTINLMGNQNGAVITMRGKYKILSDSVYTEEITEYPSGALYNLKGKINILQYKISNSGNKMALKFNLGLQDSKQTESFNEEWRKVKFYDASN